jgi:hypothetical protein
MFRGPGNARVEVAKWVGAFQGAFAVSPVLLLVASLTMIVHARLDLGHWPEVWGVPAFGQLEAGGPMTDVNGDPWPGHYGVHFRLWEFFLMVAVSSAPYALPSLPMIVRQVASPNSV